MFLSSCFLEKVKMFFIVNVSTILQLVVANLTDLGEKINKMTFK